MRLIDKQIAIRLRKGGKTYAEICKTIPQLSKGTLSHWLSNIVLNREEQELFARNWRKRVHRGILKAAATHKRKKRERLRLVYAGGRRIFTRFQNDAFFVAGIILYWAEGAKTTERVQFMNSDPQLVILMLRWFQKYLKIPKSKIRLRVFSHKIYAHEKHEVFWKKILPVPAKNFFKTYYKPTPHTIKKNPNYRGCVRVDAGGVTEFHMIHSFQQEFARKFHLAPVV